MKAHITDAQLVPAAPQLVLPIRALRNRGVIASDRVLPEVLERRRGFRRVKSGIVRAFLLFLSQPLIWLYARKGPSPSQASVAGRKTPEIGSLSYGSPFCL